MVGRRASRCFTGRSSTTPPLAHQEAYTEKEIRGWDDDHPTWQIQYLGRWARDLERLVFPYDSAWDMPALPEPHGWRYTLGIDVGHVDEAAFVVWAAHRNHKQDYVLESHKESGLLIAQYAYKIRQYRSRYKVLPVVMDTGGMGKQHAEELRRIYGIPIIPADKREKASAMVVLRDRIREKNVVMLDGERNDALRGECASLVWNEDKTDFEDGQVDHAAHAALYGHRRLRNYLYEPKRRKPEPGTREWYDQEEQAIVRNLELQHTAQPGRPKWDQ